MPIVDGHNRPLGVLSIRDAVEHLAEIFEPDGEDQGKYGGVWLDLGDGG